MIINSHQPFQNDFPPSHPALCPEAVFPEWAIATGFLSSGFHLRWTTRKHKREFRGRKKGEIKIFIPLIPPCTVDSSRQWPSNGEHSSSQDNSIPRFSELHLPLHPLGPRVVIILPLLVSGSGTTLLPNSHLINQSSWNYSTLSGLFPIGSWKNHWCWKWP